jgi:hypothetical protein
MAGSRLYGRWTSEAASVRLVSTRRDDFVAALTVEVQMFVAYR